MNRIVALSEDGRTVYWTGQAWIDNERQAPQFDADDTARQMAKLRRAGLKASVVVA